MSYLPDTLSGTAKYARISSIFRSKIISGSWPVGFQVPTIDQLSKDYNVARITIRQAINRLVNDGLVKSERGRGTFVTAAASNKDPMIETIESAEGGAEFGPTGRIKILSRETDVEIPASVRRGRKAVGQYMRIRKTHSKSNKILFMLEFYLLDTLYDQYFAGKEAKLSMQDMLKPHFLEMDVMVDTVINVIFTDHFLSEVLECEISSPAAELLRTFYDLDGHILAVSSTIYRADLFRFKTTQTVREYFRSKFPSNTSTPR